MKPAPFLYAAPESLAEALELLAREPYETRILAGGQSLIPLMNLRLAKPAFVLDINRISELASSHRNDGHVAIGALVRHATLEGDSTVKSVSPLLAEAAGLIGHPQIRHRGTIGGSLAEADPAGQLPTALLALDGSVVVRSTSGSREVASHDLFVSTLTTSLNPDEMIVEVRVPIDAPRTASAYVEVVRRQGDFALVGVAVVLTLSADGVIQSSRIALAGMDVVPVRATVAESTLTDHAPNERLIGEAARLVAECGHPVTDSHATEEYRRRTASTLTERALKLALARAPQS